MMSGARDLRRAILVIVMLALAARALRVIGLHPVSRYVVEGPSMEPAFHSGDRVLVNRLAYRSRPPRGGEVVILRDPERPEHVLLKRIAETPHELGPSAARVYVLGDNAAESRDSRAFGTIALGQILGKAWIKY